MVSSPFEQQQFLAQIEKISEDSNLTLNSLVPVESSGNYFALKVELSGSYDNFKKFLRSLENNLLITEVNSFSISSSGSLKDSLSFQLKIKPGI